MDFSSVTTLGFIFFGFLFIAGALGIGMGISVYKLISDELKGQNSNQPKN